MTTELLTHGLNFDIDAAMIDSRDVESLREDYENLRDEYTDRLEELADDIRDADTAEWLERAEAEAAEVRAMLAELESDAADFLAFAQDFEDYAADYHHGEQAIAVTYFTEYAQQLAEDIGALEHCDRWPASCIDWEAAAAELAHDYTVIEHGGTEYYVR